MCLIRWSIAVHSIACSNERFGPPTTLRVWPRKRSRPILSLKMALLLPGDKRRLGHRGEHRADTEFHRHKRHRKSSEVQGANSNDYFIDNCFPKACYANGNIYIVYADTPTSMQTTDRGDIFMLEASVNWSTHALAVSTGPKG